MNYMAPACTKKLLVVAALLILQFGMHRIVCNWITEISLQHKPTHICYGWRP